MAYVAATIGMLLGAFLELVSPWSEFFMDATHNLSADPSINRFRGLSLAVHLGGILVAYAFWPSLFGFLGYLKGRE